MEDFFWVIFLVAFVLGPLLKKLGRGGAGQQPPPRRPLPGQRPSPRGVPEQSTEGQVPAPRQALPQAEEENATELLPSDLWEMLTGQRPSHGEPMSTGGRRRLPAPPEEPEWEEMEATLPVPEGGAPVPATRATRDKRDTRGELAQLERRRARELAERDVVRAPRAVVSLEAPPEVERVRHAKFHQKLDHGLAPVAQVEGKSYASFRMDRMGRTELQRAILLQEILGEPKGLE